MASNTPMKNTTLSSKRRGEQKIKIITKPKPLSTTTKILDQCLCVISSMTKVESKEPVPRFRGSDAPTALSEVYQGYVNVHTKESQLLVDTMRSMFGYDRHYRFDISTALNMSSSGTGAVNSTISCSTLTSNPIFVALAVVFNECFVERFDLHWEPVSEYNYPLTGVTATSVASLPIGKASLQHGQTAYSSLSTMTNNYAFKFHNTGRPFKDAWVNVEDSRIPALATTTGTTQQWTSVGNIANYLGSLQFMSQAAPPALPISQVLGTFQTTWSVLFRVRV